jgi:tetratricopeptide (TPR) repeat protein
LYKDAEKLIEDFFQNFEMQIAPRTGCDEVAVQRVKETLAHYLEFTGDESDKLERSELESVFRAALTDFLYEVYFTLEDQPAGEEPPTAEEAEEEAESWADDLEDDADADPEGPIYEILSLGELCDLLREDPDTHSDCGCLVDKAIAAAREEDPRSVLERLEALVGDLGARNPTASIRQILADGFLALGEVHAQAGETARAIAAFRQAARTHGRLPQAFARVAAVHLAMQDLGAAVEAWREQIRLGPDDPEPYFACAQAYETLGKPERAVETLRAMVDAQGGSATALDTLIRLLRELGQEAEARQFRERILALPPPRRIEDIAVWVKHHTEAGHYDSVLEHLHREELDAPGRAVLNLLKALVFLAKDDPDNVEVELLLLRDKMNGRSAELEGALAELEQVFGKAQVEQLRRAVAEHVTRLQP